MKQEIFTGKHSSMAWQAMGRGKPIMMLHGWGSSSKSFHPLAKQLLNIRTSYLLDLPGFGESPEPPAAWTVDDYADLVEEFMVSRFADQKVDLLVHSFGARVAIKLLGREAVAKKIDKVVFTGAAGLKPKRKPDYYLKKYTAKILKFPFYILPKSARERGFAKLRETSLWKKLGSSDYQKLSGVMRETFVKTVTEYLDAEIRKIDHEVLLLWGKNDTATPLDQGKRMKSGLKNSTLIEIDEAGHYAFLDRPQHFANIVKAYLEPAE